MAIITIQRRWRGFCCFFQSLLLVLLLACLPWISSATNSTSDVGFVVNPDCNPCVNRTKYKIRAIVHGTSSDKFWIQIREAALQSARDMRVELRFDLYETYDAERMALDILEAASPDSLGDRPDALIVTIPEPVVEEAIRDSSNSIPIFGMNSGYDRARDAGILGFVAMDEYVGGREAANELMRRQGNGNISKALYINSQKGNSALDARYQGFSNTLQLSSQNVVEVEELVIDPFTGDGQEALSLLKEALMGCTYDAILLGGGSFISLATQAYAANGCTLGSIPLGTFDTNREIFDAVAVGKLSFAISQQHTLQGSLPVVLASVYATTGFTIAKSSESRFGVYLSGPEIIDLSNLPSDTLQNCENEAFPICQALENDNDGNEVDLGNSLGNLCPCIDRSSIRIGGVLHGVTTDSFWDIVFEQTYQAADDLGVVLDIDRLEPQPTPEILQSKMASRIISLCQSGVDGLFVTIPDDSIIPAIEQCQELNIPVISVNAGMAAAQKLGLTHHISQLEYEAGKAAGEALISEDITEAICINIEAENVATQERCRGFKDAVEAAPQNISYMGQVEILDKDMGTSIRRAIEEFVGRDDDWSGLAILNLGPGTAGDIIALKEEHPNFVSGSFDINNEISEGIENGVFLFGIDQNPFMQGYLPVWLLTLLASTKQSLKNTFIETGPAFIERPPSKEIDQCFSNLFEVCPRPENHDKNFLTQIRPAGLALCGIAMFGSIFFLAWCWYYRNNMVVRKSQPFFLQMICIGTCIMASSIIPLGIDDSVAQQPTLNRACNLVPWLFSIGFTTAFSALFSKIRRINILMKSAKSFKRLVVKPIDVLPTFTILLTLNVIFMLVWTLVDPMYFSRTEPIAKGDGLTSMGTCKVGHGKVSQVMLSLLIAVFFLVVVLANVEAYKARKINTEYSESKYVAFIMLGMLQLILLGIPLIALVSTTNPAAFYFVVTAIIFVLCISLLGGIFVPKMFFMKRDKPVGSSTIRSTFRSTVYDNPTALRVSVSGHFIATPDESENYMLTKKQIPILAQKLGCDADELKSMLHELNNRSKRGSSRDSTSALRGTLEEVASTEKMVQPEGSDSTESFPQRVEMLETNGDNNAKTKVIDNSDNDKSNDNDKSSSSRHSSSADLWSSRNHRQSTTGASELLESSEPFP